MNSLQRWNPNSRMLWNPVRMFEDWDNTLNWASNNDGLDVYEDDGKVYAEASLPGIKADDINITYENGMLRIQGETNGVDTASKRKNYKQARIRSFDYLTTLPRPVDADKIDANLKDGVLTISAPVSKQALPKQIPISSTK